MVGCLSLLVNDPNSEKSLITDWLEHPTNISQKVVSLISFDELCLGGGRVSNLLLSHFYAFGCHFAALKKKFCSGSAVSLIPILQNIVISWCFTLLN